METELSFLFRRQEEAPFLGLENLDQETKLNFLFFLFSFFFERKMENNKDVIVRFGASFAIWIRNPERKQLIYNALNKMVTSSPLTKPNNNNEKSSSSEFQYVGPMPLMLQKKHIPDLFSGFRQWVVMPKTDGTRYLFMSLESDKPRSFFINRAGDIFAAQMTLHSSWYQGTLMDGELTEDGHFHIFDCFCYFGQICDTMDYISRLAIVELALSRLSTSDIQEKKGDTAQLKKKEFYPVQKIQSLIQKIMPKLPFRCDGLVFTCISESLRSKQNIHQPAVLKWKDAEDQTVDFHVLEHSREENWKEHFSVPPHENKAQHPWIQLWVQDNQILVPFAKTWITVEEMKQLRVTRLQDMYHTIVECKYNKSRWIVVRLREDRDKPNSLFVANKTKTQVFHGVPVTDLFA